MITLFGIPVPLAFLVVPALVVASIACAASYAMVRFTELAGIALNVALLAATQLIVALILSALAFASSRNLVHPEAKTGFAFAVFYALVAWVIGFVVAIPSVYGAVAFLQRT